MHWYVLIASHTDALLLTPSYLIVFDSYKACGTNSISTGQFLPNQTYTCTCMPGFVSPYGNGTNCYANCSVSNQCGSNAACTASTGVCSCNYGYYSPNYTGTNCQPLAPNCKLCATGIIEKVSIINMLLRDRNLN